MLGAIRSSSARRWELQDDIIYMYRMYYLFVVLQNTIKYTTRSIALGQGLLAICFTDCPVVGIVKRKFPAVVRWKYATGLSGCVIYAIPG